MFELPPDEPSIAAAGADPGRREAATHEARGAQTFVVTSGPAATPTADTVEAMLSGGIPAEVIVLAVRTAELARGATGTVAERRRAFDRERKRRASESGPPTSEPASPPSKIHEKRDAVFGRTHASNRGTHIPNNWVLDGKWLPSLTENDGVAP